MYKPAFLILFRYKREEVMYVIKKLLICIAYVHDFDLAEVAPRYNNSAPDLVKVKGDTRN